MLFDKSVSNYFALFFTSIWSSIIQVNCIFILDANDIKSQVIRVSVFRYFTAEILCRLLAIETKIRRICYLEEDIMSL